MTKIEALETVMLKVRELNEYLNETDPERPINIIDGHYDTPALTDLAEACDSAESHLQSQIAEEFDNDIYNY